MEAKENFSSVLFIRTGKYGGWERLLFKNMSSPSFDKNAPTDSEIIRRILLKKVGFLLHTFCLLFCISRHI